VSLDELLEIEEQPIALVPVIMDSDPSDSDLPVLRAQLLKPCLRCNTVCP